MNYPSHQAGEWQRQAWIPVLPICFNGLLWFPYHFPFHGYSKLSKLSFSSSSASSLVSMLNCLVSLFLNYFEYSLKSHSVWLVYYPFFLIHVREFQSSKCLTSLTIIFLIAPFFKSFLSIISQQSWKNIPISSVLITRFSSFQVKLLEILHKWCLIYWY